MFPGPTEKQRARGLEALALAPAHAHPHSPPLPPSRSGGFSVEIPNVSLNDEIGTHCQRKKGERERECTNLYSSTSDFQQKTVKISFTPFKCADFTLVKETTCQVTLLLNFVRRVASLQIDSLVTTVEFFITATWNKISPCFSPGILYTAPPTQTPSY